MGLQDWKKYSETKESPGMGWSMEYYSNEDNYSYVKAWHTSVSNAEMKRRGHAGTFIVGIRDGDHEEKKYFKTKAQAKTYAMRYMKTH